jgi:phosphate starvation-inducible PhoH-like protein
MQNATPGQVKMLMTRIGEHSKIVITGDIEQADKHGANNGLLDICNRLTDNQVAGMSVCEFEGKDIQRHPIIDSVLNLYKD